MKSKQKMSFRWVLLVIALLPLLFLGGVLVKRLEGNAPAVAHDLEAPFVGEPREIVLDITESGRGLQSVQVVLSQDGRETILEEARFEGSMLWGGSDVMSHRLPVTLDARALALEDGDARMRIEVRDYSWRNWWHGNQTVEEVPLVVDTRAPQIEVLSRLHYVNQGGSGAVVYRLSETCPSHGIRVGERFFPGFPAGGPDPKLMTAFFAVAYDQGAETPVLVSGTDFAGNETRMGFHCRIRSKTFRKDVLKISEAFVRNSMIPLLAAQGGGQGEGGDLKAVFLAVNREMRQANYETLTGLGRLSVDEKLWEGAFLRLPKSATRAQFADHRTYRYKGAVIDRQVHLGVDLASIRQSPVPASNSGRVVFADNVGIYGNTVVVDHGLGLFSLYSHLSSIAVASGTRVTKGDVLGNTGITGLAVGDHLHFGMMVHDTFVNPVEWWDPHWIDDNILNKLALVPNNQKQN